MENGKENKTKTETQESKEKLIRYQPKKQQTQAMQMRRGSRPAEKQVQELSPFEGVQLKMGPAKSLVKIFKVSTFIPKDIEVDSKQELFEALINQNDLDTDQWTAVGGKSSTNGEFLVLHVDEDSLK
ncbi:hypothetical protein J6590_091056 [Homalodisca vitripennis]|nr:hypothetical protein J6590_091056 [Homalodisca vitripennis]